MPFEKGKSGNPKGRTKGSVNHKLALKNLLEEVFEENRAKAKSLIQGMFNDPRDFRRLCELKAQFEIKEMPNKLEGSGEDGAFKVIVEIADENNPSQESGNRISQYLEI